MSRPGLFFYSVIGHMDWSCYICYTNNTNDTMRTFTRLQHHSLKRNTPNYIEWATDAVHTTEAPEHLIPAATAILQLRFLDHNTEADEMEYMFGIPENLSNELLTVVNG